MLDGEAGQDGVSKRCKKKKKNLDVVKVFFFKFSKYFTFSVPLNNASCRVAACVQGAASRL